MPTTKSKDAKKPASDRRFVQMYIDPDLHANIRQQAKFHGMTVHGFAGWMFRTWIASSADVRAKSLSPNS